MLTTKKEGRPILKCGKTIISVVNTQAKDDSDKHLIGKNPICEPLPDLTSERFVEYIAGPSGSGKSTLAALLAKQYRKAYPKRDIYIFSRTTAINDPAFKGLKMMQVDICDDLLTSPIDIQNDIPPEGCLMIYDDIATINNDQLRKQVEKLICDCLEVGRKLKISLIITSHLIVPNDRNFSRVLLNEINIITIFPQSGTVAQIRQALNKYFGLTNAQIDDLIKIPSRWVRVSRTSPMYVAFQTGAFLL